MHKKLNSWENNYLTMVGRTTLIKTTLSSILIHVMQMVKLPKQTLNAIDKINRDFLWGSSSIKRKIHHVKWNEVCKPLNLGGLGIPRAEHRNFSLIMNLAWRYQKSKDYVLGTYPWEQIS